MLFGFIFITMSKNGIDLSRSFNIAVNKISGLFFEKKEPQISYVNDKFKGKKTFKSTNKTSKSSIKNQEKVDAILDKISQSGYNKLTKAEKDFLFLNSKK